MTLSHSTHNLFFHARLAISFLKLPGSTFRKKIEVNTLEQRDYILKIKIVAFVAT